MKIGQGDRRRIIDGAMFAGMVGRALIGAGHCQGKKPMRAPIRKRVQNPPTFKKKKKKAPARGKPGRRK